MVWGSVYFWMWFGFWANLDSTFATAYLLYPFLENVVLLACVNWSWHAFNNPNDPEDEYVRTAPARALTSRLPAYPLSDMHHLLLLSGTWARSPSWTDRSMF